MTTPSIPTVAIIGAGPGGLLLARYLQLHSIPCTIYERETSRSARTQGGSLDLHEESGQLALKEAGLLEKFLEFARKEGEQMRILDGKGKVWLDHGVEDDRHGDHDQDNHEGGGRPEIDRWVATTFSLS
jgi:2-polyprenyl-6-methoxyphenol hydroxylase-like FAD-dependent oxidoreductase